MEAIVDFVNTCDLEDVQETVQRQIDYNYAIAREGIRNDWGANIGKVLQAHYHDDIKTRVRAMAAAGSDARMSGCEMPAATKASPPPSPWWNTPNTWRQTRKRPFGP